MIDLIDGNKCSDCVYKNAQCPLNNDNMPLCKYSIDGSERETCGHFEYVPGVGEAVLYPMDGMICAGVCLGSHNGVYEISIGKERFITTDCKPCTLSSIKLVGKEWVPVFGV